MEVFNIDFYKSLGLIAASLLLGILIGNKIYSKSPRVVYVSQEEILEFERSRVQDIEDPKEKQMFFGKPKEAAVLMENIARERNNKDQIVVFSAGKIYGSNVTSISEDVYDEAIKNLVNNDSETDVNPK